ncbi:MAG: hypothetical protein ACKVHE_32900 [Planctomycetales bacterium]
MTRYNELQREWLRKYWSLEFVRQLLSADRASLDDASDGLERSWPDGGQWRGSIPKELRADGLIVPIDAGNSTRASRKGCLQNIWGVRDRAGLERRERQLADWLTLHPVMPDGNSLPNRMRQLTLI